jgi:hypothetical protein
MSGKDKVRKKERTREVKGGE